MKNLFIVIYYLMGVALLGVIIKKLYGIPFFYACLIGGVMIVLSILMIRIMLYLSYESPHP